MIDSTKRFSNRVENYVKYRPTYPTKIIDWLSLKTGFNKNSVVADVGSGTGIFTQILLDNGNTVYAVEPNTKMRLKAEKLLHNYSSLNSINGTAEHTTLPDLFVDFITVAQAFHWFNSAATRQEFSRILKPDAYCVLIWNERQSETEFEKAYENLLMKYAVDYSDVKHRNINHKTIAEFFAPQDFITENFSNNQIFDFEGLKGRLLSSSYIPDETQTVYPTMINELNEMFNFYQTNNTNQFNYSTKVYLGKLK